tara:strand:- start:911 stop:1153 length:243 start_codon:yes stop_codon:yes gene_type:complete
MKIKTKDLLRLISKALNVKISKINEKSKSTDFEQWDSLGHLAIMTALDKKLKGSVNLQSITEANSVKQIINLLKKKKILS